MSDAVDTPKTKTGSQTKDEGDDDTSTKATEEVDSDATMGSSDTKKDGSSDAETVVDEEDARTQEEKDKEVKEKEEAEKKRIEELKIKYKDWPLKDIKEPHDNDVMYGRGGGTNHHPGNKRYRTMVESRKVKYVNSKRLDKPLVALEIIREWRAQLPPGRFLKHNEKAGNWDDVGDKKAREKTSQALREKAPQIRKQQEEEQNEGQDAGDKTTRFAEDTKGDKKTNSKIKKAILARDHSLGREYLASDENVDLRGFTWQDPFKKEGHKNTSIGSLGSTNGPATRPGAVLPPGNGRESSVGSCGSFFSQFGRSAPPPPSVPDYWGRVSFGEPRREFSNGSMGSLSHPYIPPPPGASHHQRSGSWTYTLPHPPPHGPPHHQRSGSWNAGGGGREHSFSMNPLQNTSINRPAPAGAFDPRPASGAWNFPQPAAQHGASYPPPPPPPPRTDYGGYSYQSGSSMGTIGSIGQLGPPGPYSPSHAAAAPSHPYDAIGVARTWSGGGTPPQPGTFGSSQYDANPITGPVMMSAHLGATEQQTGHMNLPRPAMVKRDTSNQNESYETKPSRIKKAALNRDQSATSNRLKQQYIPEVFNKDMQSLHEKTEKIRLSSPVPDRSDLVSTKPAALDMRGRQTTVDAMEQAMTEFLFKNPPPQPAPLNAGDRKNTMDELGYDLIGDSESQNEANKIADLAPLQPLSKPSKLTPGDRMTTVEINEIVNATFDITDDKVDNESPLPL